MKGINSIMYNTKQGSGAGVVAFGFMIIIGIVLWIVISINNANVPAPEITTDVDRLFLGSYEKSGDYKITIKDGLTGVIISTGDKDKICDKESDFSLVVNGENVSSKVTSYCNYTIKNESFSNGENTYEIVAKNKSGEDRITLKVTKAVPEETEAHKYPMTSSGMDLPTASHINCKNYASDYFYPYKATLENVIGDDSNDAQDGDGWIYRPLAKVTSSAGGTTWYQVVCKTDLNGHVTSFYAWE